MVNAARGHEAPKAAEAAEPARPDAPPPAPASSAQVLALQRGAGNAAVARMLQRASAPEPGGGLTRDPSQLEILPKPPAGAKLDYLDYTRSEDGVEDSKKIWRWSFRSATWDLTASWTLYDSSGFVVSHSTGLAVDETYLKPDFLRHYVEERGPSVFGEWTMRLEKDAYYDDHRFTVTSDAGQPSEPLGGRTTESYYSIREFPSKSARILGKLEGEAVDVTVDHKEQVEGLTWYRVTLKAPVGDLSAGSVGWLNAAGVVPIAPWPAFRAQLSAWEAEHLDLTLTERITLLRQMCHEKGLPFDRVIGTQPGREYLDTRPYERGEWALLKDYQQVEMPDGHIVDVYHVLVGLDVLPRRHEDRTIWWWGHRLPVGQNYAAATWSGDIGAGAADGWLAADAEWERQNPGASLADRQRRYFTTRASEPDLLADIDAWGIDELKRGPGAPDTIEGLLAAFYGAPAIVQPGQQVEHTSARTRALERFLDNYGLTTEEPLKNQPARNDMADQILIFARVFVMTRDYFRDEDPALETDWALPMADMFLEFLQRLVAETGADVPRMGIEAPTGAGAGGAR